MSAPAPSDSAASGWKRSEAAAASERCVQPRLLHTGPILAAIGDDGADTTAAAASAAVRPPSAVPLDRDAVGCVFQFLRQGEVATALQVSRVWLAAVRSMANLQLQISLPELPIDALAQSAMGRHVAAIGVHGPRAALSADSLHLLAHRMPQLRGLVCDLSLPPAPVPLFFPVGLRQLDLHLADRGRPADVNAALRAIGRLQLLEELTIIPQPLDPLISFAPLAALPLLRALAVSRPWSDVELSDAQVDELRALQRLQKVGVPMSTSTLGRLLRQPHSLQWQEISLPYVDDETAALLPRLPSLTELNLDAEFLTHFDFLQRLPNLASLQCSFGCSDEPLADRLAAALRHCAGLVELTLHFCTGLSAAHLADLLPRLPRLQSLGLSVLDIDSLSFLAQPPLTDQLSALRLVHCRRLPVAELRHLHSLRGLLKLEIGASFDEQMDPDCDELMALRPPSAALPLLQSFSFYHGPR